MSDESCAIYKFLSENDNRLKESKQRIFDALKRQNMALSELMESTETDLRDILVEAQITAKDRTRFLNALRYGCPESLIFKQYSKLTQTSSETQHVSKAAQSERLQPATSQTIAVDDCHGPKEESALTVQPMHKLGRVEVPSTVPKYINGYFNLFYDLQAPTPMKSVNERMERLILACFRTATQAAQCPRDVTRSISQFAGRIIFVFDTVHEKYRNVIQHNGVYIYRPGRNERYELQYDIDITVGSSVPLTQVFSEFSIKCIYPRADMVGILSDLNLCRDSKYESAWCLDGGGGNLYCYGKTNVFEPRPQITCGKDTQRPRPKTQEVKGRFWKADDVVSVRLDQQDWTVAFYLNGVLQGEKVSVRPHCVYYPFIATRHHNADYQIMYEYRLPDAGKEDAVIAVDDGDLKSLRMQVVQPVYLCKKVVVPSSVAQYVHGEFNWFYDLQAPTPVKSVSERMYLLVVGWSRNAVQRSLHPSDITPCLLSSLSCIAQFAGQTIFVFDTVLEKYCNVIQHRGTYVYRPDREERFFLPKSVSINVGSSMGFNDYFTEFNVRCVRPQSDVIGIVSDLSVCSEQQYGNKWCLSIRGVNMYGYLGMYTPQNGCLVSFSGDQRKARPCDGTWKPGDILTVKVDHTQWTVAFYLNSELIGNPIGIASNSDYYPFIGTRNHGADYQIVNT